MLVNFVVREQQWMGFFTEGSIIVFYGLIFWPQVMVLHSSSLHNMSIDGLELCELLVDYCDVFISCLDSYSDGTHSLQRIHWWASDVKLNFSKSVLMKKQTQIYILDGLRVNHFSAKAIREYQLYQNDTGLKFNILEIWSFLRSDHSEFFFFR